jgi:hypothetical protein
MALIWPIKISLVPTRLFLQKELAFIEILFIISTVQEIINNISINKVGI